MIYDFFIFVTREQTFCVKAELTFLCAVNTLWSFCWIFKVATQRWPQPFFFFWTPSVHHDLSPHPDSSGAAARPLSFSTPYTGRLKWVRAVKFLLVLPPAQKPSQTWRFQRFVLWGAGSGRRLMSQRSQLMFFKFIPWLGHETTVVLLFWGLKHSSTFLFRT